MAKNYIDLRDLRFLLNEVHDLQGLLELPYYQDHDMESLNLMLDSAKQLADAYLFPYFEEMDRQEPELVDGEVKVHPGIGTYLRQLAESGWIGAVAPYENGGLQVPVPVSMAANIVFQAANNGAMSYPLLTTGAANLIESFGSESQKATYLPGMYDGTVQGTMALTEPQAGSSLSDVETTASPRPDGSYRLKGHKIYISGGDYDQVDNVVHMTLARIEGASAGVKGTSLFIVPKYRRTEDGDQVFNDVQSAGIYHKMGQKATPAMHLIYGENDDCHGYLMGEPNLGLKYMFQMMNEARLGVGAIGAGVAAAAYHASREFAHERPQGRRWGNRDLNAPQTLIINHPDIQRQLLFQRFVSEGSMSLLVEGARLVSLEMHAEGETQERAHLLLDLLTPIMKAFPTEYAVQSVSAGMQILGGGGYCKDFPLEQLYRDIRITTIYEGTTAIQAQDLLGRKVTMKGGAALSLLAEAMGATIKAAKEHEPLRPYAKRLAEAARRLHEVTEYLVQFAQQGEIERYLADASLYLDMFGLITVCWQWLEMGVKAQQQLLTERGDADFYREKIRTMQYAFHYELPKTLGLAERLLDSTVLTLVEEEVTA